MNRNIIIILLLSSVAVLVGAGFRLAQRPSQVYFNQAALPVLPVSIINFLGEKGENVNFNNEEIRLETSIFNDNQARFYNVNMPASPTGGSPGKTIYFFVVKDKNGIYRAAANACAVCFKTYKGFHQEGNEIVCNNCGNRYPIEKIATEKGGCNPGPINPNLEVENGEIIIKKADLEQVLNLF